MELHKAIREVVSLKGTEIIANIQIVNFLLDYQAFKEKPATKLILRDIINAGYAESILALRNTAGWQVKFLQYQHEFIDSCGYKEELAAYVFESIAYALGLTDEKNDEPRIKPDINVDLFFDIPEIKTQQPPVAHQQSNKPNVDPTDLYTIALSFYNEGKYQQAKGFMEKALSQNPNSSIPSLHLKLMGDIHMKLDLFLEAINYYNECFSQILSEKSYNSINAVREALKQHKIKGFENSMFFYFYCIYCAKGMSDIQWLQFVKDEARFGLIDAIKYCADNGINPIDKHIDIYFIDRELLQTGDILYEDGSFSHELSDTKKAFAHILLVQPSDYEISQGWSHGYIIPISPIYDGYKFVSQGRSFIRTEWEWSSKRDDLPFPHSHYTKDDINHYDRLDKVESEQFIQIKSFQDFPAFATIDKLNQVTPVPMSNTSNWFLPSIHTIKRIASYCYWMWGGCRYWTSSQCDANNAISFDPHLVFSNRNSILYKNDGFYYEDKGKNLSIYPVAVF